MNDQEAHQGSQGEDDKKFSHHKSPHICGIRGDFSEKMKQKGLSLASKGHQWEKEQEILPSRVENGNNMVRC
jgi:hypothetical protein